MEKSMVTTMNTAARTGGGRPDVISGRRFPAKGQKIRSVGEHRRAAGKRGTAATSSARDEEKTAPPDDQNDGAGGGLEPEFAVQNYDVGDAVVGRELVQRVGTGSVQYSHVDAGRAQTAATGWPRANTVRCASGPIVGDGHTIYYGTVRPIEFTAVAFIAVRQRAFTRAETAATTGAV